MTASKPRLRQPKTSKGKKHIAEREPSLVEPHKKYVFIKGKNCNSLINSVFSDFIKIKSSTPQQMKHVESKPFDDNNTLDNLMNRGNFSLFLYGSSNKKNPNLLTMGRYFNGLILDMFEFKINNYTSIDDVADQNNGVNQLKSVPSGAKCVLSFSNFDMENDQLNRIKNLFIDFFNNGRNEVVIVSDISYLIHFSCESEIDLRFKLCVYKVDFKGNIKQNVAPAVKLVELGPLLDIQITNTHFAEYELLKDATTQPKSLVAHKPKNIKNVERDDAGGMVGKIHIDRQDLSKIKTKRVKALKRSAIEKVEASNLDTN